MGGTGSLSYWSLISGVACTSKMSDSIILTHYSQETRDDVDVYRVAKRTKKRG